MEPNSPNPGQMPDEADDLTRILPAGGVDDDRTRIVPATLAGGAGQAAGTGFAQTSQVGFGQTSSAGFSQTTAGTFTQTGTRRVPSGASTAEQVGRYQLLEKLGQGAMAVVYKAYDPSINRTLAIKFLLPQLCVDEEYRERFVREARAAGNLSHPNIATVFDVGEIDGQPYIAMELLEGEALNDVMEKRGALPIQEVLEIGIQLARALDYAHSKGVVHRDIKPGNLIRVKGDHNVKVTDFGIAHIETREGGQQTRMGAVMGTPQYMSPEQALGQEVDGRSDLFSVGVVLYHLATGQKPFTGDSLMGLMQNIIKTEPKPPEHWRPDIPPGLRRIIKRCLAKQPDKRYATGRELADALVKVIRDLKEEAERRKRNRIIPLRVRWALMMGVVIAVTMAISSSVLHSRLYSAMMTQVMDYGASLSKFMATESAVPALTEDWVAIDVFIKEAMRTQDFHDITVLDHRGVVQVSSNAQLVSQPYRVPDGQAIEADHGGVKVHAYTSPKGVQVIDFEAPITFQSKQIGRVHLGILERPMTRVAELSLYLMTLLAVITVVAVVLATYLLANRYSKPIRLLKDSMAELGEGRLDYRIAEQRKDEFGELYEAFDAMAATLQKRMDAPQAADGQDKAAGQ